METPRAVGNPRSGPLMLNHPPMVLLLVFLLAPPLSPRGLPICRPRRGAHVRVTPVVVVHNKHQQWLVMCSKTNPDPPKRSYK